MQHALNGGEALRQLVGRVDLIHAGQLQKQIGGLLHLGVVLQGDHIAVAQILWLNAAEGAVVVVVADKALKRFLTGNELCLQNVVQKVNFGADRPCFGVGQTAVDVHKNFAGLI